MRGLRIRDPANGLFVITPDDYITKFVSSARVQLVGNQTITVSLPGITASTHYVFFNEPASSRIGDNDSDPAINFIGEIIANALRFTSVQSAGVTQSARWTVFLR